MEFRIGLIEGDGIGPEVINEAVKVLCAVGERFGHSFSYTKMLLGGCAIDATGKPYPDGTTEKCKECDAILLGAVGGPKWDNAEERPEQGLLRIRAELGLYANIRPASLMPALCGASPLKPQITDKGFDFVIVRELTGGLYFGQRGRREEGGVTEAYDTLCYNEAEIERIGRTAFSMAMQRRKNLVSVDKANVLETSRLWRAVMHKLSGEYPEVVYSDMLVDNCAMQLVRDPSQFDVIVTENMFGDILSDEAAMLTGSIGLLPSASMGASAPALYEPVHGSAPQIAGTGKANPIATILSASMMLRYSFNLVKEADAIEEAVRGVLDKGYRTSDIAADDYVDVSSMGNLICEYLLNYC